MIVLNRLKSEVFNNIQKSERIKLAKAPSNVYPGSTVKKSSIITTSYAKKIKPPM